MTILQGNQFITIQYMEQDLIDSISDYYHPLHLIKKGAFGKVFQCSQLDDIEGNTFAVKVIDKSSVKRHKIQNLRNQAKILETIHHQNIVRFLGLIENEQFIYIKMECARGGTLGEYIKKRIEKGEKLTSEEVSSIMRAIFEGVGYLHANNIIHRDLKPQNILLAGENDLSNIKIADFGMSIQMESKNQKISTHCGTLLYMAPEIVLRKYYSKNVDIWSCAIIMYMLFNNGNHPLIPRNKRASITNEEYALIIAKPWSELEKHEANDLLKKLSVLEGLERYCANDALKHPFFGGDYAPLTYLQTFKGFEVHHDVKQLVKTAFIISSFCEKSTKLTVSKQYLDSVEKYNEMAVERKIKESMLKRDPSFRKITSDNDVRFFGEFSNGNSSEISSSPSPIKKTRFSQFSNVNLIQNAFLSQTTQLKDPILIRKNNSKFHIGKPKKNQRVGSVFAIKNPLSEGRSSIQPRSSFKPTNSINLTSNVASHTNYHANHYTNTIVTNGHINLHSNINNMTGSVNFSHGNSIHNNVYLLKSVNRSVEKHSERDTYTSAHKRRISLNSKSQKDTIVGSFFKR